MVSESESQTSSLASATADAVSHARQLLELKDCSIGGKLTVL